MLWGIGPEHLECERYAVDIINWICVVYGGGGVMCPQWG